MVSAGASDDVVGALDDDADVQAHDGAGLGAGLHQRIPVAGVQRRQAEPLGQLGEGHGAEAALGVAAHLVRGDLRDRAATAAGTG